jgi:outer membrane protein assembly factor BamA
MARATIEYRHPIYSTPIAGTSRRQEMFRFLTFVDAGILGLDAWSLDTEDVRASVGFGFGLVTPLPLTFNFGFPFLDQEGDRRETFSFSLDMFR